MDYEKAYNDTMTREEALRIVRKYNYVPEEMAALETLIPELAESEDEKIRKWLYDYFKTIGSISWLHEKDMPHEQILAYLEKQKEQKPNFDTHWENGSMVCEQKEQKPLTDFEAAIYSYLSDDTSGKFDKEVMHKCAIERAKILLELAKKEKPVEWSEEDKDYYDTIVRKLEVIGDDSGLSDNQIKFLREHCPLNCSEWNEEDEDMFNDILLDMADRREMFKSKGETTFADNTQKKIDWLDSHHLSSCLQPKPVWSEEDEKMRNSILDKMISLDNAYGGDGIAYGGEIAWLKDISSNLKKKNEDVAKLYSNGWSEEDRRKIDLIILVLESWDRHTHSKDGLQSNVPELIRFVKSLRPSWKPNEEQMEAFKNSVEHIPNAYYDDMWELYEQLKKL